MDFLQIIPTWKCVFEVQSEYLTTNVQIVGHVVINVLGPTFGEIAFVLPQPPVLLSERSEFVVPKSSSNEEGPIADYPLKWNYTLSQLALMLLMLHLVSGVPRGTTWDKTRRFVVTSCSKFFKVCANYSNFCQLYQLASTSCNVSSSVLMITITLETGCSEVVGWNSGYIIMWHTFLLITMCIFYQT